MGTLGKRLRTLRNEKKLLQSQFGDMFGLSASAIGAYERNEREPTYSHLVAFADYFNVSLDFLLCRTDERLTVSDYLLQSTHDYKQFIDSHKLAINGYVLTSQDKQRLHDAAYGMFFSKFE